MRRTDDAVAKCLALLGFGEAENENCQYHGVIGTEQTFEGDEKANGDEIGSGDVQAAESILAETQRSARYRATQS